MSAERAGWPVVVLACAPPLMLALVRALGPEPFESWMREDGWAEWSTFAGFVIAGGLYLRSVTYVEDLDGIQRRLAQVVLVLLGLFCLLVAGEEISWGQRLMGYTPPDVFLESNYQQELNLHNLSAAQSFMGIPTESRFLVAYFSVVYGLLGPLVGRWVRFIAPAAPPVWLAPLFAAVAVVEWTYPVDLGGEAAEMTLALAMIASVLGPGVRARAAFLAAALVLGPTLALVTGLVFGVDEAKTAQARAELVALGEELLRPGGMKPGLFRRSSVHKRVFTARKKYLRLEDTGRPRFFVDPWGNPYWIHARRGRDTVWLYSFGANRKRDLRPDSDESGGDDVLVEVRPRAPEG